MKKKTTTPTDPDVTVARTFVERLPVTLLRDELFDRGKDLATANATLASLEAKKKEMASTLKAEVEEAAAVVSRLSQSINFGWENRDVECEERHLYAENRVVTIRVDTGELVRERPMGEHERQRPLPIPD